MIKEEKKKKKYKNKWLEHGEQSCIIPFEHCVGELNLLAKMH